MVWFHSPFFFYSPFIFSPSAIHGTFIFTASLSHPSSVAAGYCGAKLFLTLSDIETTCEKPFVLIRNKTNIREQDLISCIEVNLKFKEISSSKLVCPKMVP